VNSNLTEAKPSSLAKTKNSCKIIIVQLIVSEYFFVKIPNNSIDLDLNRVYLDIGVERYLDDLILVTDGSNIGIAATITFHNRASG
jgi:hypothetical protein